MMQFMQLAFSPATDGEVLAATTCGLARSADHGRSWQFLKGDVSQPGYVSLADKCCSMHELGRSSEEVVDAAGRWILRHVRRG
jgi:hypothetical protein